MHDLSLRVPSGKRTKGHSRFRWTILVCLLVLTAIIVGLASPAAQAQRASEACAGDEGCISSGGSSGGNDAPTARDDRYDTKEDGKLAVKASGVLRNDAGNRLSAAKISGPRHGSLALERNGSFVYTPDEDYNGADSFTYEARNGKSDRATVRIDVKAVNDAPSFVKGNSQAVDEDAGAQSIARWATGISAGPGDESGQRVGFVVTNGAKSLFSRQPAVSPDGKLSFTPKAETAGETMVSVKLRDSGAAVAPNDNESDTKTFKISVREVNDDPSVTATNDGPVDEGGSAAITASATDPDTPASSFSYQFDCNGDGDYADAGDRGSQPGKTAGCSFPESGDRTVNARVMDGSGGADTGSTRVRVANVAPTANFGNGGSVDEGSPATVSFTNQNDVSLVDLNALLRYEYRCDGSAFPAAPNYATASTDDSTTCTFGDDGLREVRARIIDEDGGARVYTTNVTVENVKPSISLTGPSTANEGETKDYSFTVTDPGSDDTHTATTSCGTGQKVAASYNPATRQGALECEFTDGPSTTDVTATVTDSDGASDTDDQRVTVDTANVAPTVELTGDATADEGQTNTYTYTVTDPGTDPNPSIIVSCGGFSRSNETSNSFDCTFVDGPADPTVGVAADDGDPSDSRGVDTIDVTVANVAPTVVLSGPDAADEGETKTYTYTVTDPGRDPNPAVIEDCGTGAVKDDTAASNSFDCTFVDGPATPTVSVSADDGDPSDNTGSDTQPVDVSNLAPTADGQSVGTDEDTAKTITLTGSDPVGAADPLSFKVTSLPDDGTLYEGNGTNAADEIQPSDLPRTLAGSQVTYEPDENFNGSDVLNFRVNDGDANSTVATVSIQVNAVNDAPTVGTEAGSASYTEGGQAIEISPLLTLGDPDTANLAGATVSITTGLRSGDTLSFDTQNGINGNYDSGTGVLTMTGSSSVENYRTALRSVEYSSTSNAPGASRTVSFQVNDGETANNLSNTATRDVSITETNSPPDITTSSGTTSFTENDPAVAVDNALTVTDSDSGDLVGATVSITGGLANGQDGLSFTDQNGITGSTYDAATGVLTLTGNASVSDYQAALRSVRYDNTSDTPDTDQRTVSFQVDDGSSVSNLSNTATKDISVAAANDVPRIDLNGAGTGTGHSATFTEDGTAVSIVDSSNLTVTDADDANIDSATVTITNLQNGAAESLDADEGTTGITTSYTSATGELKLTGIRSKADYRQVLRTVTYDNTSQNPGTTDRNVAFVVNDGDDDSNTATSTVTVNGINDAPVLDTTASTLTYTENDAATAIDSGLTLSDVDSANMGGATVTITSGYAGGEDVLSFTNQNGITGTVSVSGDTLTLSGSSSVANYQAALRSVKYSNTSENPSATQRVVTFRVDDGGAANNLSNTPTRSIDVIPVNDAPVADNETFNGSDGAIGNTTLVVNDPDDGAQSVSSPKKSITGDILAGDTDVDGPGPLAIQSGTFATNDGGSVTLESDGDFTFRPAASTSCTDTSDFFDYTVEDSGSPEETDTGRVTIAIAGCVWYVSNNAAGNSGTSNAPFDTIAQAETASGSNNTVFVFDGDNTSNGYNTGFAMNAGERLIGEHEGLAVDPDGGGVLGTETLYAANPGAHPTLTGTNEDVVALDDSNEVRGFNIDPQGTGGGIAGGSGDTLGGTIDDVNIVDNGTAGTQPGLELDSTTGTFNFSNLVVSTNGATGVRLHNTTTPANAVNAVFAPASQVSITSIGGPGLDVDGTVAVPVNLGTSTFDDVTVTNSNAGGVDITNATGTTNLGDGTGTDLSLTTTSGTAPVFGLANAGTITVPGGGTANVSATGGPAIDVTGTSGASLAFDDVDSTNSSGDGINLDGLGTGTFSATSGDIGGYSGIAFDLNGGSGNITYPGNLNNGSGASAEITGRTGGSVALSGNINDTNDAGGGIAMSGNTGGSTEFSGATKTLNTATGDALLFNNSDSHTLTLSGGGLDIDTTSGKGIEATTSGTLNVTGAANTVDTGAGKALNVTTTDVGSTPLTFQRISSNGANGGIVLDRTGANAALTITGNGGTCDATTQSGCSGGVIQGSTGADSQSVTPGGTGIVLNDTRGISLTRVNVRDHANYGLRGASVVGFSLTDSVFNGTNGTNADGGFNESSILFDHVGATGAALTGSSSVTRTVLTGGYANQFWVSNDAGSLNRLTFDTVRTGSTTNRNDSIQVEGLGTATTNVTVRNSTFTGTPGDHFQYIGNGSGGGDLQYEANVHTNNHPAIATGGGYITLSGGAAGPVTMNVFGANTFRDGLTNAITMNKSFGGGSLNASITGAQIGVAGVPNSGSLEGSGITFHHSGGSSPSTGTVTIANNVIHQVNNYGILVQAGAGIASPGTLNATVTNNQIANPGTNPAVGNPFQGILLNSGVTPAGVNGDTANGDSFQTCAHIAGNSLANSGRNGGHDLRVRQRMNTTVRLPGYAGASTDAAAAATFLASQNTVVTRSATVETTNIPSGGGFVGGAACPQ